MKMVNTLKRLISIFSIFATSLPVLSYSATQSSYPTKGIPVAGDKALITDSADGNKTKQATVGSFPISTATQTALDGKETKAVVQASAPADTTVDWYDTDQESGVLVLKRHNGTTWARASSHGVQYAPNCAGITAGMCVDTDDGKLYYHNNTSVVEVGTDTGSVLTKTNTTAFSPTGDYHPATKKYVDDAVTAGGGYTDEQAQDAVGAMLSGNTETGITVTYDDSTGKVDFVVATQSDVNFTSTLNTKLAGIATGAEVNVNADWNASSGDAQILNKPSIPTAVSQLSEDSTHRTVSDTEKTTWNAKQNALIAGTDYLTPTGSAAGLTGWPTLNQNTTGSAARLSTARTIAGSSFDGTANIDISYTNLLNRPTITDDQTAAEVPATPWSSYTGTNVQALMQEVDTALRALIGGAALPTWMPSVGPTNGRQILQATGGCSNATYSTQAACEAASATWTTPTYQHTSIISGLINDTGTADDDLWSAAKITSELSGKQASLGFTPENAANKGTANGYAGLGSDGKVPSSQLPTLGTTYDLPSLADAQAGTSTTPYVWSPQRVAQAIVALAPSGGNVILQQSFVSASTLVADTGAKNKLASGVDWTTADVGCDVSGALNVSVKSSATINGTYTEIGTISLSGASSNSGVDISSWANSTAGHWIRIDITGTPSTVKDCVIAIGGSEL